MATCFAPSTTAAPRIPLDIPFASPPATDRLKLAPNQLNALQSQLSTLDLQSILNRFIPGKTKRECLAHELIFSQGDPANAVFYIQTGKVRLTVVSASGKEAVLAHLPTGSFFGEAALAEEQQRLSSACSLDPSTIIRIEKKAMQDLLDREPEFARSFRAHLLARHTRMQADLVDQLFNSSEKRLARLLMLMANFGQDTKPTPVIAKISQESLAEMIGTTRSRVSFFLNRFRSLGYIFYNSDGMVINSSLVNIVLHD